MGPLSAAHAVASAGDGFVTVSLAGSLFFNVSPDASRSQVLLYLVITMVPFVLLAPFVGPIIDHFRRGQRMVAAATYGIRAAFCIGLAVTLFDLTFYVIVLALLVANRAQGVIKQALIPKLVGETEDLVTTNARLAKLATVAGGTGLFMAGAIQELVGAPWALRIGALLYLLAAVAILRVRPITAGPDPPPELEYAELHTPSVMVASLGFMAIRAAVGFFVFMLAFTFRRASEPPWVYGAAVVVYGAGAFLGNVVAPYLRRRFHEEQLIAVALAAPAVMTLIAIVSVTRGLLIVIAFLVGMSTTLARQGFDSLVQRRAPDAVRGRAFARYETRFQLSWVLGGILATAIVVPAEFSMVLLSAVYLPAIALYLRGAREARRYEGESPDPAHDLAMTRLAAANGWRRDGYPRLAVIDAVAAADLVLAVGRVEVTTHVRERLDGLRQAALDPEAELAVAEADRAIALARDVVRPTPPAPPAQRPSRSSAPHSQPDGGETDGSPPPSDTGSRRYLPTDPPREPSRRARADPRP